MQHLLEPNGVLASLSPKSQQLFTGRAFFPQLISAPFHQGLIVVFTAAAILSLLAAIASLSRGSRPGPSAPHL
jgi:hypothetical protein